MTIELVVSSAGGVRQVTEGGRQWLVVPAVTIVPGVLPGSKGPLLYPASEVEKSVPRWDGTPVTVYHPTQGGQHVSGRSPGVKHIGVLRNSSYDGRLKHEVWIDVEKADAVDKRVVESLKRGHAMELSTGLYTDNEEAAPGGRWSQVARNYRPDHLAILPDQIGACSINDGCGLLVNDQARDEHGRWASGPGAASVAIAKDKGHTKELKSSAPELARHLQDPKTGATVHVSVGGSWTKTSGGKVTHRGADPEALLSHLDQDFKAHEDAMPMKYHTLATNTVDKPTLVAIAKKWVENARHLRTGRFHRTDQADDEHAAAALLEGDRESEDGRDVTENMSEQHDASKSAAKMSLHTECDNAFDAAKGALQCSADEDSPGAAKAHQTAARIHDKEAVKARKDGEGQMAEQHEEAANLHRKAANIHSAVQNREVTVNWIQEYVLNDSPPGHLAGADRAQVQAAMAAMAEERGPSGQARAASAKAKSTGNASDHAAAGKAHREAAQHHADEGNKQAHQGHNRMALKHERAAAKAKDNEKVRNSTSLVDALIANGCVCSGDREAALNAVASFQGESGGKDGAQAGGKGVIAEYQQTDNEEDEDEDEDDETRNQQWLASAPRGIRETVRNAMKATEHRRKSLVDVLVANVASPKKQVHLRTKYMKLPMEELEERMLLVNGRQNYLGAGEPITVNEEAGDDDALVPPVMNFNDD